MRGKVRRIALVEGLGQFGQDDLAPLRHFGGHHAGSIAPVELAQAGFLAGGLRVGAGGRVGRWRTGGRRRGGRRGVGFVVRTVAFTFVMAFLAAQLAVGVARGLSGLVVALLDVGFGVAEGPGPRR